MFIRDRFKDENNEDLKDFLFILTKATKEEKIKETMKRVNDNN